MKLEEITIINNSKEYVCLSVYANSIAEALKGVTNKILISKFIIDSEDFETITKASCNSKALHIIDCKILITDEINLKATNPYIINEIVYDKCIFCEKEVEKETDPSKFEYIVLGMSNTELKDSLKKIDISSCSLDKKNNIQLMFNKYGVPTVTVIDNTPKSLFFSLYKKKLK